MHDVGRRQLTEAHRRSNYAHIVLDVSKPTRDILWPLKLYDILLMAVPDVALAIVLSIALGLEVEIARFRGVAEQYDLLASAASDTEGYAGIGVVVHMWCAHVRQCIPCASTLCT